MVFRVPIDEPVQTSLGIMYDRPAVLVRVEDSEGAVGWGEIWCNFPGVGAEHRARVLESAIAPILLEWEWKTPEHAFRELSRRLHILGIQCGEPGTIAQAIAGADIALCGPGGEKDGPAPLAAAGWSGLHTNLCIRPESDAAGKACRCQTG